MAYNNIIFNDPCIMDVYSCNYLIISSDKIVSIHSRIKDTTQ